MKNLATGFGIEAHVIGQVGGTEIIFKKTGWEIINISIKDAVNMWEGTIESYMK